MEDFTFNGIRNARENQMNNIPYHGLEYRLRQPSSIVPRIMGVEGYNSLLSSIYDMYGGAPRTGGTQYITTDEVQQTPLSQAVNPVQSIMQAMSIPQTAYMANTQNNAQLQQVNYGNQGIFPSMFQNMWQNQYNQGQVSPTIARPFMGDNGMNIF